MNKKDIKANMYTANTRRTDKHYIKYDIQIDLLCLPDSFVPVGALDQNTLQQRPDMNLDL